MRPARIRWAPCQEAGAGQQTATGLARAWAAARRRSIGRRDSRLRHRLGRRPRKGSYRESARPGSQGGDPRAQPVPAHRAGRSGGLRYRRSRRGLVQRRGDSRRRRPGEPARGTWTRWSTMPRVCTGTQILAVNVIAPYLLTALIGRPARLVYLSSGMRHGGRARHPGPPRPPRQAQDSGLSAGAAAQRM